MVRIPYTILIVEDHDATRRGLRALLTNAGYTVAAAGTFAEGRRLLTEQTPDLLIADLRLGEYNGFSWSRRPAHGSELILTGFPIACSKQRH